MQGRASLIRELEVSIRDGSHDQRVVTLRRVTDLFVQRAEQYDAEQVRLFDDVIVRLAAEIEKTALDELANRLAPIANAPEEIIRRLAFDDSISVAGPVLAKSPRLSEDDLVEIVRSRGREHRLAISSRNGLGEAVTDILVESGDAEVAHKVVANAGARFSEKSFLQLVERAGRDEALAEGVGRRIDIPPHLFRKLVSEATARVRQRLLSNARADLKMTVEGVLAQISEKVGANPELASRGYSAARSYVNVLVQSDKLGTRELVGFARAGRFEEAVAALAAIAQVPIDIVDRVMHGEGIDPLLLLCRARGFDWAVVRALLLIRRNCRPPSGSDLEQACQDYNMLSPSTAERVLRFWQVRQSGQ